MGFLNRVVGGVRGLLWPERFVKGDDYYRQQLYKEPSTGIVRGQWYQLRSAGGKRTGYEFNCLCGTSYTLLESEARTLGNGKCPHCQRPLDFSGRVGLKLSRNKDERSATLNRFTGYLVEADWALHGPDADFLPDDLYEHVVSLLSVRPDAAAMGNPSATRVIDTWSDSEEAAEYETYDPGASGVGFTNPR
jgi:hypothetical protein